MLNSMRDVLVSTGKVHLTTVLTQVSPALKGVKSRFVHLKKFSLNFSISSFFNPCQSSSSLAILVPLWVIIISLVFFYLSKLLFSGFLQFKGNFGRGQNNSKYRECLLPSVSYFRSFSFAHERHAWNS